MAQLVKHLTLDFSSGHGLIVCEFEPHVQLCADSEEPAWDSLSPSLSALPFSEITKFTDTNRTIMLWIEKNSGTKPLCVFDSERN